MNNRKIAIDANKDEADQVRLAASLRGLSMSEYIKRAINASLRREGVDAVLFRQSDDELQSADARLTPVVEGQASGSATETDLRTAIAHLTEERNQLRAAYKRLVADASPRIAALTEAHERLRTALREAIDGYAASHKYDHGEWHFDHNDLPSEGCPECQAHRDVIAKWESALLSPREGTIATDRGDKDLGLPGSAATKGL